MADAYLYTPIGFLHLSETAGKLTVIQFLEVKPASTGSTNAFLEDWLWQMQRYFDGKLTSFSWLQHTRQEGTSFQQRVWEELKKIPFGATVSYKQLAIRLGDEKCTRAAASANGQNNLAIVVPCHRVIGSDGSLTGYAGGLFRKKWLLDHEAKYMGKLNQASFSF